VFFWVAAVGFLSCLLLGGGTRSGFLSDAVLQLLSVPILLAALWRVAVAAHSREARRALAFCGAILAVPLLQLVPLPPALWTHLPGRDVVVAAFELIGRRPAWAPLSMAPRATWLSALSLLPPLAVFLSVLALGGPERRLLSLLAIAFGVASALLGLIQYAQGVTSSLLFFEVTNPGSAVGFFANKNHFAALLYSIMPLAAAWLAADVAALRLSRGRRRDPARATTLRALAMAVALVVVCVAEVTAASRAGLILTLVGLFAALALTANPSRQLKNLASSRVLIGALTGVVGFALLFWGSPALFQVSRRFDVDPLADARVVFARNTILAAKTLMPVGAGLGAFVPVYASFERPSDLLPGNYVNHAHDDLLEIWLETGVVGPLLLCVFLYWLVRRAARAWGPSESGAAPIDQSLRRAAIVLIALLFCHSLVDYPLRAGALMAMLAFACALLIDPAPLPPAARPLGTPSDARRRSRSAVEPSSGDPRRREARTPNDRSSRRGGAERQGEFREG
jgi:O-antigen ligase